MGLELACSNFSRHTLTNETWSLLAEYDTVALSVGVVLIIFMLVGVPWNLIVIGMILKQRLFLQPAMLLLLNLAITDFLLCAVAMPLNIVPAIAGEYVFGDTDYTRCQVCQTGIIMTTLLLVSVYNIALLSLDRLLYVRKALSYEKIVTAKRVVAVLTFFWLLFAIVSLLPLFGVGRIFLSEIVSTCTIWQDLSELNNTQIYLWAFVIGSCAVPILVLLITNIWMVCIIQKEVADTYHRTKRNTFRPHESARSIHMELKEKYKRNQLRLIEIFAAIFICNFFTWVPTVLSISLVAGGIIVPGFIAFGHLSLLSQAVFHPILQVIFLRDIRARVAKLCTCCSCKSYSIPGSSASASKT